MRNYNFSDIKWGYLSNVNYLSSVFINCLLENFLSQVVHEPSGHTALYLILTNSEIIRISVLGKI